MAATSRIWEAEAHHVQGLITLGSRFHKAAKLPGVFCPGVFGTFCDHLIRKDEGVIFMSDHGMIGGYIAPLPWDATYKVANEAFWWSEDGQGMALMEAYETWAADRADEVRMAWLPNMRPTATARILGARGYVAVEVGMVKQ